MIRPKKILSLIVMSIGALILISGILVTYEDPQSLNQNDLMFRFSIFSIGLIAVLIGHVYGLESRIDALIEKEEGK